jgi:hypothetical protein
MALQTRAAGSLAVHRDHVVALLLELFHQLAFTLADVVGGVHGGFLA